MNSAGPEVPVVGPDNRKGARAVGDLLAAKREPGDPVAILEGVRTADQHAGELAVFGIDYALQIVREGLEPANRESLSHLASSRK